MKTRVILFLSLLSICFQINGQIQSDVTCENYVSDVFKGVNIVLPEYREITSGTKFNVTYEGDWPEEMKGAFEYAVKIWEENVPTTLPISIKVKLQHLGNNTMSKVLYRTWKFSDNGRLNLFYCPTSMIKYILLHEDINGTPYRFREEVVTMDMLTMEDDIIISYNTDFFTDYSFSIDDESTDKYDFVTVALRDIALGLGFGTSFTADTTFGVLNIVGGKYTPFETAIVNAIGVEDPFHAYRACVNKGKLEIKKYCYIYGSDYPVTLYSPNPWVNGLSLRRFIPDENNPLTKLLTYDFGKGFIMRDLSGFNWLRFFEDALDWRLDVLTGGESSSSYETGSTDNVFPFKGEVDLSFDNTNYSSSIILPQNNVEIHSNEYDNYDSYCDLFHVFAPYSINKNYGEGLTLSVLLNSGKWDIVHIVPYLTKDTPILINIEDCKLNYSEDMYARSASGGLRYRLTSKSMFMNMYGDFVNGYSSKYFTRSYTPQTPVINRSNIENNESLLINDDEYYVDVKIGLSNIEGTQSILVEQLEEGSNVPFLYSVTDFKKGYFMARLDRELDTQLSIVSYNENGSRRSNVLNIPAIGFDTSKMNITRDSDYLKINGISSKLKNVYSANIVNVSSNNVLEQVNIDNDNRVYIGHLRRGIYIFNVLENGNVVATEKIVK